MLAIHGLVHTVNAAEPSAHDALGHVVDLSGKPVDPFATSARARVFLFVRADCPITNRYAPELHRLAHRFPENVDFWLVYPDPSITPAQIRAHMIDYSLPGQPLRDPQHELVKLARALTAPEGAVFDSAGKLEYHGRIDDLWVSPGIARPMARQHDLEDAIASVLDGKPVAHPATAAIGCSLADLK